MATIKGKWLFNGELTWGAPNQIAETVSFDSNGSSYYSMGTVSDGPFNCLVYGHTTTVWDYDFEYAYIYNENELEPVGWRNDAYRTVDFGTTEQIVSDEFYTWLTANAKPVPVVQITYNGAVIASLKAGQTATLHCKDKPMLTDVVVSVPEGMGGSVEEWDGSYTVSGGASEATVTIINNGIGCYVYNRDTDEQLGQIPAGSTASFTVPVGTTLRIIASGTSAPGWSHGSLTGDIERIDSSSVYGHYLIKGDGTITGTPFDDN